MGNSLQDQLLKAGLVDRQKAKQIKSKKRKRTQQQNKGQERTPDQVGRQVRQTQVQKAAQDRELNRRRQEAARRKAVAAEVRQLIEQNRVAREQGEVAYNFTDGNTVKKIYVTPQLQQQLVAGRLAIVRLGRGYELVPVAVAEKIGERDAAWVIYRAEEGGQDDTDDMYAEYKVPDDLMW